VGASVHLPFLSGFLVQPGEGPEREEMEKGWLKVHGMGVMKKGDEIAQIKTTFSFIKDTGYFLLFITNF